MNSVLCVATSAELNDCRVQTDRSSMMNAPTTEESYATAPMAVVNVASHSSSDEEVLHTAFEEAISERIVAMQHRLSRISNPLLYNQQIRHNTDVIIASVSHEPTYTPGNVWQRWVLFSGLILLCVMVGFDLMGLLVLHMH